jgi:hypothetical protein
MAANREPGRETAMTDLLMIVFTVAFFALALLYAAACEELR